MKIGSKFVGLKVSSKSKSLSQVQSKEPAKYKYPFLSGTSSKPSASPISRDISSPFKSKW